MVAWLSRLNPVTIVIVSFLFSVLEKGSSVAYADLIAVFGAAQVEEYQRGQRQRDHPANLYAQQLIQRGVLVKPGDLWEPLRAGVFPRAVPQEVDLFFVLGCEFFIRYGFVVRKKGGAA